MAKIIRHVEDVSIISVNNCIIEIEEIEFIGDDGKTVRFKIDAVVPISTEKCEELDRTVDWDKKNFHILILPGVKIND